MYDASCQTKGNFYSEFEGGDCEVFLKKIVLRKCFLLFLYQCKFYSKKTLFLKNVDHVSIFDFFLNVFIREKTCFLYGEETMMCVEKLFFPLMIENSYMVCFCYGCCNMVS